MSLCLSQIAESGKKIINISDQKVNFGTFSADNLALKDRPLFGETYTLFAGDDTEHVEPILSRTRQILAASANIKAISVQDAADAVDLAYSERLHKEIENRVLRKRGFTIDSFRNEGRQKCTPSDYLNLCTRIDKVSLSLKFIVSGFSGPDSKDGSNGRIFTIDGMSAPKSCTPIGMWAIGSGKTAALGWLAYHIERLNVNWLSSEAEALYYGLTARFMAETDVNVGRGDTVIYIAERGKPIRYANYSLIQAVRQIWEQEGAPQVPKNLEERMTELIMTEMKSLGD
jgi:hypothetical protein